MDDTATAGRRADVAVVILFGVAVYTRLLLMAPGRVVADTKSYLYLDPGRLLSRSVSMWDPHIGLGTTTHQNIGYTFPMGPFYWVTIRLLHLPPWVAQRLWLGTLLLIAGLGMRALMRTFGVEGAGVHVAMFAYALTPYALEYSSRLSALIFPWAVLPWLLVFTARALVAPRWREAASIALLVQLAGSVNASSLFFVLLGPLVYVVWSLVTRSTGFRTVCTFAVRTALLVTATSLWWLSGLWVEGRYGLNILKYTETLKDVSRTLYPSELLRGLGYWMFYGRDPGGFWNDASLLFAKHPLGIALSLVVPAAAFAGAATLRWRYRSFFSLLVLVGVVVGVGAAPYTHPSIAGGLFKSFAGDSSLGLALRSTARATPLIVLGLAGVLGGAVSAWSERARARVQQPRRRLNWMTAVAVTLCGATAAGLWSGTYYSRYLERGNVPDYWQRGLAALDAMPHDTRVLSIPGADFAAYSWGNTIDPIEPGLMDRPFIARELVPWGSAPGASLLTALDTAVQDGTAEPRALAEVARLMNTGHVVVRLDMDSSRYGIAPASQLWASATSAVGEGLSDPTVFGDRQAVANLSTGAANGSAPVAAKSQVPAIAVFPVVDPVPIVRTAAGGSPILISGDGQGFVDLASAGLLDGRRTYLSSGAFASNPGRMRELGDDSVIVVTDTNRRRSERGLRHRFGYTETAGERPLVPDLHDQRLEAFPGASDAARTVAVLEGVRSIRATAYGSQFGYTPENRPAAAFDGNPGTAWTVHVQEPDRRLQVELEQPISTTRVGLANIRSIDGRYVASVDMRFDGGPWVTRRLRPASVGGSGEFVTFPRRTFSSFELRVGAIAAPRRASAVSPASLVGFSEIALAADTAGATPVRIRETMRLPTDVLDALGGESASHPLVYLMTRESTMDRADMRRTFSVVTPRTFDASGEVTFSRGASDASIDTALGIPDAAHGGLTVSSSRAVTTIAQRASNAVDSNLATVWEAPYVASAPPSVRLAFASERSVDSMRLRVVDDGHHAVPTELRIAGGGQERIVEIPAVGPNGAIALSFAPVRSRELKIEVTKVAAQPGAPQVVAVAEFGLPGILRPPMPSTFPSTCTRGALSVDGKDLDIQLVGDPTDAVAGRAVPFVPCPTGSPVRLDVGPHVLVGAGAALSTPPTPWVLRRATLVSNQHGEPAAALAVLSSHETEPPRASVRTDGPTSMHVRVPAASSGYWLVLGQSINEGWHATIDGHDLGPSTLVNGFANGWRVDATTARHSVEVSVVWKPQKVVDVALWTSFVAAIMCVGIVIASRRRDRGDDALPLRAAPRVMSVFARGQITGSARGSGMVPALLGISAAFFVRPWVGVVVAFACFAAMRDHRVLVALRLVPAVILICLGLAIGVHQIVAPEPAGIDWSSAFKAGTAPTWIALFLFVAGSLLDSRSPASDSDPDEDQP